MSLHGLFVPLVTPFDTARAVDVAALEKLAGDVLAGGADGLVALGTTGEPATLDAAERRAVVTACARVAAGRPLVVGAGGNSTRASVEALQDLAGTPGVTAALVPVPPYTRPGWSRTSRSWRRRARCRCWSTTCRTAPGCRSMVRRCASSPRSPAWSG